jgi:hypothetical protein
MSVDRDRLKALVDEARAKDKPRIEYRELEALPLSVLLGLLRRKILKKIGKFFQESSK